MTSTTGSYSPACTTCKILWVRMGPIVLAIFALDARKDIIARQAPKHDETRQINSIRNSNSYNYAYDKCITYKYIINYIYIYEINIHIYIYMHITYYIERERSISFHITIPSSSFFRRIFLLDVPSFSTCFFPSLPIHGRHHSAPPGSAAPGSGSGIRAPNAVRP